MSAHLNSSHTMTPHTAGATGDDRRRKPQRNLRAPDSSSFNITQTDDLFNQAAPPPHHHVQTHIELRCPNVPGFLERPCQYPCDAGNWYNTPTTVGRWDLTTAVQPGIVAPDQLYQAGTQQENVPSNRFAVPGLMNQSTRPANSPAEENTHLRCGWTNCTSRSTFNRWADLSRHIKTIHVFPASHVCVFCNQTFNRKDNLDEHRLRTHRFY